MSDSDPGPNHTKGNPMKYRLLALIGLMLSIVLAGCGERIRDTGPLDQRQVQTAEEVTGLELTPQEESLMLEDLEDLRHSYSALRENIPSNSVTNCPHSLNILVPIYTDLQLDSMNPFRHHLLSFFSHDVRSVQ